MRAAFSLKIDGDVVAGDLLRRVKRIVVSDELGLSSDTINLDFDDSDSKLSLPEIFVSVETSLPDARGLLVSTGVFAADEIEIASRGYLRLTGKGFDSSSSLKTLRSRSFGLKEVKGVFQKIANEAGLVLNISEKLAALSLERPPVQYGESDLSFLQRLCQKIGARYKISGNQLVIVPRASAKTVSGKPMPSVTLSPQDVEDWSYRRAIRNYYRSVEAVLKNTDSSSTEIILAGQGKPAMRLPEVYFDRSRAELAANSALRDSKLGSSRLTLVLQGNARLKAESKINCRGFRKKIDGPWIVEKSNLEMSESIYTQELQLIRDEKL